MANTAIKIEHISKMYHIGGLQTHHDTLSGQLRDKLPSPKRWAAQLRAGKTANSNNPNETIWALADVSFEIKRGEIVGIIGSNGAGKSTLLKILSRITDPTTGRVEIYGRIGSLLEVGTGFHPDLTGRENIFLNGAILGMKKLEIERKFDEIVAFAEIDKFIDTPVKYYSSGMYVRLAFSVAAHLEPEILLVDEVLAVGDAAFQKKCLGKMGDSVRSGRTVLFVSHDMMAMQKLCNQAIWLFEGKVNLQGPTPYVVQNYLSYSLRKTQTQSVKRQPGKENGLAYYEGVHLLDANGNETNTFFSGDTMFIEARLKVMRPGLAVHFSLDIDTIDGMRVSNVNSRLLGQPSITVNSDATVRWKVNELRLMPGRYAVNLRLKDDAERDLIDYWESALAFEVIPADVYNTGEIITDRMGITYFPYQLEVC